MEPVPCVRCGCLTSHYEDGESIHVLCWKLATVERQGEAKARPPVGRVLDFTPEPAVGRTEIKVELTGTATTPSGLLDLVGILEQLNYRPGEFFQLCTKLPGPDEHFRSDVIQFDAAELAHRVMPQDRHVWISVNPTAGPARSNSGRGGAADVTRLAGLPVDLDVKPGSCPDIATAVAIEEDLAAIVGPAGYVTWSGHGLQPVWPIVDGVIGDGPGQLSRDDAQDLLHRWGRLVDYVAEQRGVKKMDPVFDLPRILRCPGTVNWKKPEALASVLTIPRGGTGLTVARIRKILDETNERWLIEQQKVEVDNSPPAPLWTGASGVTPYLRRALEITVDELSVVPKGEWNKTLYKRAFRLGQYIAGAGLPEDEARAALEAGCRANDGRPMDKGSEATINSGFRGKKGGMWCPKAVPEGNNKPADSKPMTVMDQKMAEAAKAAKAAKTSTTKGKRGPSKVTPIRPDPAAGSGTEGISDPDSSTPEGEPAEDAQSDGSSTPEGEQSDGTAAPEDEPSEPSAVIGGPENLTDSGMTDWLVSGGFGADYRCVDGLGWLHYDGTRWAHAPIAAVIDQVRVRIRALIVAEVTDGAGLKRITELTKLLFRGRLLAITQLVGGTPEVASLASLFDIRPDLLNCANGTVDLRTGELLDHDPADMLTKITPTPYIAGATHPDWSVAMDCLPPDVVTWMQLRVGQAATGHPVPDDVMPILQGTGENGKSTFIGPCKKALGEHAVYVSDKVLLASNDSHSTEKMDLRGARFALHEELPEGRHLNVKRLKDLNGTEDMTARLMRENSAHWTPTHTLFVTTNYQLQITETDWGTWRRLLLVVFPYTFTKTGDDRTGPEFRKGDPGLRQRLKDNTDKQWEAVLAWIVAGAVEWYRLGREMPAPPAIVVADTLAWRGEVDQIGAFLSEMVVADEGFHIASADLLRAFNSYSSTKDLGAITFGERVAGHAMRPKGMTDKTKTVRNGEPGAGHVSRPPAGPGLLYVSQPILPVKYKAWTGVRFREYRDDVQV